ncbi:futalosine hydrolase [Paenibacillus protaetiae]|uniref:Futalosine hydrolase n=1 Tax=Paenibacillus protaetiae TaxID=2509456 RepID=A0A4V0YF74_9BACL|nr:futalosine hydrolase [Paenibacillus protaetiae]QAY66721.1 futalosine hydrolase [Paenibacillus protaetiae]
MDLKPHGLISQSESYSELNGNVLVMVSVEAEREAVLRGLQGNSRFEVRLAGVGMALAAANTAFALAAADNCGLVISAGIAGGFAGQAAIGDIVVATDIVAADLGAESPDGFLPLDELGFGSCRVPVPAALAARAAAALQAAGMPAKAGPVLTVATATGTAETALRHAALVPGAAAEGMEGYGVAAAAQQAGLPAMEVRAVSNAVGPRDKAAWRIKDALNALEQAFAILTEVL